MQLCSVSISDINKALDKLAESKQPMTRGSSWREPPTPSPWFRYEHSSRKRREREGPPTAARPALRYAGSVPPPPPRMHPPTTMRLPPMLSDASPPALIDVPSLIPVAPPDPDTPTSAPDILRPVQGAAIFEDFEMQTLWERMTPISPATQGATRRSPYSPVDTSGLSSTSPYANSSATAALSPCQTASTNPQ
ncbi:hypothetical protein E4U45_007368 [Claviceps purpurea]|nr:hypothetical protein E4U45_007368 [Claviceps purpurea]